MATAMRTTIELPDDLLILAKQFAAGRRTTLRALIERGLRKELKHSEPSAKKNRAIKWVTVPAGPPKGLDVSNREGMMQCLLRERGAS
jgi:hypothetical protein